MYITCLQGQSRIDIIFFFTHYYNVLAKITKYAKKTIKNIYRHGTHLQNKEDCVTTPRA